MTSKMATTGIPTLPPRSRAKVAVPGATNGAVPMEISSMARSIPSRTQPGPAAPGTPQLTTDRILQPLTDGLGKAPTVKESAPVPVETKTATVQPPTPTVQAGPTKPIMPPPANKILTPANGTGGEPKMMGLSMARIPPLPKFNLPAGMLRQPKQMSLTGVLSVPTTVGNPNSDLKPVFSASKPGMVVEKVSPVKREFKKEVDAPLPPVPSSKAMDISSDSKTVTDSKRSTAGTPPAQTAYRLNFDAIPVAGKDGKATGAGHMPNVGAQPIDAQLDALLNDDVKEAPPAPAPTSRLPPLPAPSATKGAPVADVPMETGKEKASTAPAAEVKSGKDEKLPTAHVVVAPPVPPPVAPKSGKDEKVEPKPVNAAPNVTSASKPSALDSLLGDIDMKPVAAATTADLAKPPANPKSAASPAGKGKPKNQITPPVPGPTQPIPPPASAVVSDKPKPSVSLRAARVPATEDEPETESPPVATVAPKEKPKVVAAAAADTMTDDGGAETDETESVVPKKKPPTRKRKIEEDDADDEGEAEKKPPPRERKPAATPKKEKTAKKEATPKASRKKKAEKEEEDADPERTDTEPEAESGDEGDDDDKAAARKAKSKSRKSKNSGRRTKAKAKAKAKKYPRGAKGVMGNKQWHMDQFRILWDSSNDEEQLEINQLLENAKMSKEDVNSSHTENRKAQGAWSRLYASLSADDRAHWLARYKKYEAHRKKQIDEQDAAFAAEADAQEAAAAKKAAKKEKGTAETTNEMDTSADSKPAPVASKPEKKNKPQPAPVPAKKAAAAAPSSAVASALQTAVKPGTNSKAVSAIKASISMKQNVEDTATIFAQAIKSGKAELNLMPVQWEERKSKEGKSYIMCKFVHPKYGSKGFEYMLRTKPAQLEIAGGLEAAAPREFLTAIRGGMKYAGRCCKKYTQPPGLDGVPVSHVVWYYVFQDKKGHSVTPVPDDKYLSSLQISCALCSTKDRPIKNMQQLSDRLRQLETALSSKDRNVPLTDSYTEDQVASYRLLEERNGGVPLELQALVDDADSEDEEFVAQEGEVETWPATPKPDKSSRSRKPQTSESKKPKAAESKKPKAAAAAAPAPQPATIDLTSDAAAAAAPALPVEQSRLAMMMSKLATVLPEISAEPMTEEMKLAVGCVNTMLAQMLDFDDNAHDLAMEFKQFAGSTEKAWTHAATDVRFMAALFASVVQDPKWALKPTAPAAEPAAAAAEPAPVDEDDAMEQDEEAEAVKTDKANNALVSASVGKVPVMQILAALSNMDEKDESTVGPHMAVDLKSTKKLEKAAKQVYTNEKQNGPAKRTRSEYVADSVRVKDDGEAEKEEEDGDGDDDGDEREGSEVESEDTSDDELESGRMSSKPGKPVPKSKNKPTASRVHVPSPKPKNKPTASTVHVPSPTRKRKDTASKSQSSAEGQAEAEAETATEPAQKRRKIAKQPEPEKNEEMEAVEEDAFKDEFKPVQAGQENQPAATPINAEATTVNGLQTGPGTSPIAAAVDLATQQSSADTKNGNEEPVVDEAEHMVHTQDPEPDLDEFVPKSPELVPIPAPTPARVKRPVPVPEPELEVDFEDTPL